MEFYVQISYNFADFHKGPISLFSTQPSWMEATVSSFEDLRFPLGNAEMQMNDNTNSTSASVLCQQVQHIEEGLLNTL